MSKHQPKKRFGQNFIRNEAVIKQMVDSVLLTEEDLIIEVGPGQGALTKELKKFNANIIAYEIDLDLKQELDQLVDAKTRIIYKDFLNADVLSDIKYLKYNNLVIIANLPYYITTPIIERSIKLPVQEMVLMVQKEVAERLAAKPGSKAYGSLTVFLNYYFTISKLFDVPSFDFYPVPNVNSSVVKMTKRREKLKVYDEVLVFQLVKDAFTQKRKTLKNNLNTYDLESIEAVLKKHDLSLNSRAEQIDINVFVEISNNLNSQK